MNKLKQWLPEVVVIVLFALISFAYFFPADMNGKILYRHDSSAGRGLGEECTEFYQRTGEISRWTNSVFGGMPTFQTSPSYQSSNGLGQIMNIYHLGLPEYVWYLFAYLLGFYILLRAFDFKRALAVLGSIIWAFSSYFLIIIAAGHLWKVMALAYLPPMIAGVVLAYRKKYLWGFIVTAIFTAFEVKANHVQMTYYYLFIILFMVIAYLVDAIRKKEMTHFLKATGVCSAAAIIGICMNISNLYHTWEYSKESMRGKSELVKKASQNQTSSGLDRDYITQWSYGIDETWTLLIPNTKGGASVPMSNNEICQKQGDPMYQQIYDQLGQYWGEQPGTSGPVYVGALVVMLFILGLFIVKGPIKWALLAATILSVILSWGRNCMGVTDFFIDYIPMYAKFRTVASILVIAEFTIPLLAMLALKKMIDDPRTLKEKGRYLIGSFAFTAGVCLVFATMPGVFFSNYISSQEAQALSQIPQDQLQPLLDNITSIRQAIFTADCWRSFWIILIGAIAIFAYKVQRINSKVLVGALSVLCLFDLWQVDKRYLNDGMFVEKSLREQPVQKTASDEQILQDKSLDYRVLNLASNTFNENETSFYHKSIGGYHPAKLRRYQEMIDAYIAPEMQRLMKAISEANGDMAKVNGDSIFPVLNMLNTKYFIVPLQNGQTVPIKNIYAYGNGWFVDKIKYVANANEELDAVDKTNLRHEAVANRKFKDLLGESKVQNNTSIVKIIAYQPNKLTYEVTSDQGGIVVFAENYYPEWTATVDGQDTPVGRVNYILRAIQVKPGKHTVVLSFYPKSVSTTETIAYIAMGLLVILLIAAIVYEGKKRKSA